MESALGTMRRGVALLEILVVTAVIGIVTAILLPMISQARRLGHQTVCLSNTRQIARAYHLYVQDWGEYLPEWYLPGPSRPAPFRARVFWPELLQPYLRSEEVFRDPSAAWEPQEELRLADYTLMTSDPGGQGTEEDPYWRWPGPPLTLGMVRRPAETIVFLEGWTTTGWRFGPVPRHGEWLNAAFLDGHVGRLPMRALGAVASGESGLFWFRYAAADR
jgi:prepilin-type processing-associated H-X9-DG protein/prepilin-type N-terminal cleavage/methylation domain-containing protein